MKCVANGLLGSYGMVHLAHASIILPQNEILQEID
jgi:hypothetical protein